MLSNRLATALSIAMLLALAGWLATQAMTATRAKPQSETVQEAPVQQSLPPTDERSEQASAGVVYLPAPPRPLTQATEGVKPKPSPALPVPTVSPLQPSPGKPAVSRIVTPLAPAKPRIPKTTKERLTREVLKPSPARPEKGPVPKPEILEFRTKPEIAKRVPTAEKPIPEKVAVPQPHMSAATDRDKLNEGRALLRVLEHGAGPTIEIAWPENAAARARLHYRFTACLGMRTALMQSDGKLYVDSGPQNQPWAINLDRFSGFIREPAGQSVADEMLEARRIRNRHKRLMDAAPVRVFPRHVDAVLLAGLKGIAGHEYKKGSVIRAHYSLTGGSIIVEGVRVDGRAMPGKVTLPPVGGTCRRGG